MAEETKKNIEKSNAKDWLNDFYNFHLKELVSAWINIGIFESKKPDEMVGERVAPPMGNNALPSRIQIKAKEALENERKRFKQQSDILKSIVEKMKEYEELNSDEKIWQSK